MTAVLPAAAFEHFPPPAFSPQRDPEYLTEVEEIARVACLIGLTLMPWQRHVIEIATQYKLDAFGRRVYRYKTILVSVPRQSGKTTLMLPVRLHRLLTRKGIDAYSTAQTGKDARTRILKMIEQVERSPIAPLFKPSRQNGAEGLQVRGSGSKLTRFSPVDGALHGETPHLVDLDEIWKYTEELGDALLGGARPGMITLGTRAQIWMISTKGTARSGFMNKWVKSGESGNDPALAYFAWQMPKGADPDDPATWWQFHPALGNTITEDDLRTEMYAEGVSESERLRAYMNVFTTTTDALVDPVDWALQERDPSSFPGWDRVGIAVEVAPRNSCAAVVAAWDDTDGRPVVRVLHQAPGTTWVPGYLAWLMAEFGVTSFAADDAGPVKGITDEMHPLGDGAPDPTIPIRRMTLAERSTADLALIAAARDQRELKHDGSLVLQQAVAAVQTKIRNGVERMDRDASLGPVPSLIAAGLALYVHRHPGETPAGPQLFV